MPAGNKKCNIKWAFHINKAAGIGLKINYAKFKSTAWRPIATGIVVAACQRVLLLPSGPVVKNRLDADACQTGCLPASKP